MGTPELGLIGKQERAAGLHRKGGWDGAVALGAPRLEPRSPGPFQPFFTPVHPDATK